MNVHSLEQLVLANEKTQVVNSLMLDKKHVYIDIYTEIFIYLYICIYIGWKGENECTFSGTIGFS
jgi:hypothetical protein